MTTNLHAHTSTYSVDCDGPFYRDYVESMREDEREDQFADLVFKERVLGNHVSFHSEGGVKVEVDRHGFFMREATDEGHRSAEVRWCEDESCDPNAAWQRDVFAEQMGY
jgi:hypothetical protein